jgi:hypothetical protein
MLTIPVTQIVSRNCGGCGAWLDNPLSSPSPSSQIWPGFQLGGGGGGIRYKYKRYKTSRKSRKHTKKQKMSKRYKKTRRN